MKFARLTALLIIPILLLAAGCERKVVNDNDLPSLLDVVLGDV